MGEIIKTQVTNEVAREDSPVQLSSMTAEERLAQFNYVKRMTKGFLILTWIVLIGYFKTQEFGVIEAGISGLFGLVTIQLWRITPEK